MADGEQLFACARLHLNDLEHHDALSAAISLRSVSSLKVGAPGVSSKLRRQYRYGNWRASW